MSLGPQTLCSQHRFAHDCWWCHDTGWAKTGTGLDAATEECKFCNASTRAKQIDYCPNHAGSQKKPHVCDFCHDRGWTKHMYPDSRPCFVTCKADAHNVVPHEEEEKSVDPSGRWQVYWSPYNGKYITVDALQVEFDDFSVVFSDISGVNDAGNKTYYCKAIFNRDDVSYIKNVTYEQI